MDPLIHETIEIMSDIQVRFSNYQDSSQLITNHWHNSLEILFIRSGRMQVWVNDHQYQLGVNNFIIINSRDIHATRCVEPTNVQLLQIPYHFLESRLPDIDYLRFDPNIISDPAQQEEAALGVYRLLSRMGDIYDSKEPGYAFLFTSLLYDLLYQLVKYYKTGISSTVKTKNDINRKRLTQIITYVKEHYAEDLSLRDAADLVSLNPEYFCRFFKKNMGTTFLDYINEVRMSHIYGDLIETENSITQILADHGFTNYKLFMKMFKEKYGCTPLKKRNQMRLSAFFKPEKQDKQ